MRQYIIIFYFFFPPPPKRHSLFSRVYLKNVFNIHVRVLLLPNVIITVVIKIILKTSVYEKNF